jgi:hypothetical protein
MEKISGRNREKRMRRTTACTGRAWNKNMAENRGAG